MARAHAAHAVQCRAQQQREIESPARAECRSAAAASSAATAASRRLEEAATALGRGDSGERTRRHRQRRLRWPMVSSAQQRRQRQLEQRLPAGSASQVAGRRREGHGDRTRSMRRASERRSALDMRPTMAAAEAGRRCEDGAARVTPVAIGPPPAPSTIMHRWSRTRGTYQLRWAEQASGTRCLRARESGHAKAACVFPSVGRPG